MARFDVYAILLLALFVTVESKPEPYIYSSPPSPYIYSSPPPPYVYSSPPPPPPTPTVTPPPPSTFPSLSPPPTPTVMPPPPRTFPSLSSPPTPTVTPPPPRTFPSLSPPPTSTLTPPPQTSGKKAKYKTKKFPTCYNIQHTCPNSCPNSCEVDCVTCSPVCISDQNLHINGHFIGKRRAQMKKDFTWVQSLSIRFGNHQLFIGAKKTSTWDDSIDRLALTFDEETVFIPTEEGAMWHPMSGLGLSLARPKNDNSIEIEVEGNFKIKATIVPITKKDSMIHNYGIGEEDFFVYPDLSFKFFSLSGDVSGVLDQTYRSNYVSKVKVRVVMPVLGGDREFASSSIFSTDCLASRFNGLSNSLEIFEYGNINCSSGMNGRGLVCKR